MQIAPTGFPGRFNGYGISPRFRLRSITSGRREGSRSTPDEFLDDGFNRIERRETVLGDGRAAPDDPPFSAGHWAWCATLSPIAGMFSPGGQRNGPSDSVSDQRISRGRRRRAAPTARCLQSPPRAAHLGKLDLSCT
jgi:hypothetical protein